MTVTLLATLLLAATEPLPAPPMVSTEDSTCAPCTSGAQCVAGKCQFTCQTNADCQDAHVCGKAGVCEWKVRQLPGEPQLIRRGDSTHPERFRLGGTVPAGFHIVQEPNFAQIASGSVVFGVAYLSFAIVGTSTGHPQNLIPFIGPILAYRNSSGWLNVISVVAIGGDVLAQIAGAAMIIVGLSVPKRWLERDVPRPATPSISFAPVAPGADIGASVVGRF